MMSDPKRRETAIGQAAGEGKLLLPDLKTHSLAVKQVLPQLNPEPPFLCQKLRIFQPPARILCDDLQRCGTPSLCVYVQGRNQTQRTATLGLVLQIPPFKIASTIKP